MPLKNVFVHKRGEEEKNFIYFAFFASNLKMKIEGEKKNERKKLGRFFGIENIWGKIRKIFIINRRLNY